MNDEQGFVIPEWLVGITLILMPMIVLVASIAPWYQRANMATLMAQEAARAMVLDGAQILLYPTAIGSEPEDPGLDTRRLWQRAMVGHAVSNLVPVVAANRTGTEGGQSFYGHSFVCDHFGDIRAELPDSQEGVIVQELDLEEASRRRAAFGFFRDRRPELYGRLARDE